jgi:NAD(P)-dependent dehydrogenase (short-subunit alcohol dehydrogenase family)
MPDEKTTVLITGASSGIGRLIAEFLARNRMAVFATMRELNDRNADAAAELRALATREALDLHVAEMDVSDDASVERSVRETIERAGRIDVLINNAGFGYVGLLESFTIEQVQRIFETNVFGALRTIRAVLPQMHRQRGGLLIQVSSGAGRIVLPSLGLYCASKFALEALTEAYRYELANVGIDSVSIEPGAYPTAILGKSKGGDDPDRDKAYGAAREIAGKVAGTIGSSEADPIEVAEAVLRIIEMPPGTRALRYRIGKGASGVVDINNLCAEVQKDVLEAFGVSGLTTFSSDPPFGK